MDSFDIARLAGVSRKTVQRVLNHAANVKPETREKVLRVMETHRYEPNAAARKLSARKSHTVGLFIVQDATKYTLHTDDLFFGAVIGAIISRAATLGYNTLVMMLDIADPEPLFSLYRQKSIDGGFIVSWSDLREIVGRMREARYEVGVFEEGFFRDAPQGVPIPRLDNYRGAGEVARYLAGLGHRRIGIVTGDMDNHTARERFRGFTDALRELELPIHEDSVHYGAFTEADGERAVERWLSEDRLPEAVFCSNDLMAYGALKALARHRIPVPEAISVVGFDDLLVSAYMHPPLTTMKAPRVEMAVQTADRLIARLEGRDEESLAKEVFRAELVERSSCAPARRSDSIRQG
ncbi:LacI family DNA-binding transcriptional regulator [Cohnella nanjingensis]|uniref:LacI family DNA-binding transcriptional regulator n=1 Tax=Cohnella nanjingensis TaxID=1387779 RepID=A0A7X0RNA2_9BACL|nr:LacI family DNA-binding transcriptional regulator [Cohnella nanjingensis]MBB6670662.1 LacI family DNA-binding transcriptional regulator [Cohnella nanjingensis]